MAMATTASKYDLKDLICILKRDVPVKVINNKGAEIIFMDSITDLPYLLSNLPVVDVDILAGSARTFKVIVND